MRTKGIRVHHNPFITLLLGFKPKHMLYNFVVSKQKCFDCIKKNDHIKMVIFLYIDYMFVWIYFLVRL